MESLIQPKLLPECPREKANFVSVLTFSWVLGIFFKGNRKTLGMEDLYQPLQDQKADGLGSDLEQAWDKNPDFLSCLKAVFGFRVLVQGLILLFIECGIKILPPIFLSHIIMFHSNPDSKNSKEAVWYSVGIILSVFFNVLFLHAFHVNNFNLGFMMKTGACSMIYRKCMRLSKTAIGSVTTGKIVNMMSNDVGKYFKLQKCFRNFNFPTTLPIDSSRSFIGCTTCGSGLYRWWS